MKRTITLLVLLLCACSLFACRKLPDPLEVPEANDVIQVSVTRGDKTTTVKDKIWIAEILYGLADSTPTNKYSIQDNPQVDNYYKLDFREEDDTTTVFIYEDKGVCYAEVPYTGIYEIGRYTLEKVELIK